MPHCLQAQLNVLHTHLTDHKDLKQLLTSSAASQLHPHEVDGAALAQALAQGGGSAAASGNGYSSGYGGGYDYDYAASSSMHMHHMHQAPLQLDPANIPAAVEAFVQQLQVAAPSAAALAGSQPHSQAQAQQPQMPHHNPSFQQQHAGMHGNGGFGRQPGMGDMYVQQGGMNMGYAGPGPVPLVAPARQPNSHAAHLQDQLTLLAQVARQLAQLDQTCTQSLMSEGEAVAEWWCPHASQLLRAAMS